MTDSTSSTTSATASAAQSILTSLNAGSGIDINNLVTSLTQAQFAAQTSTLQSKSDAITKQISDTSTLLSTIKGFSTALNSLVTGGTLQTSPTVSNTSILTATAKSGAKLAGLSASLEVDQLAAAQSAATAVLDPTAATGTGTLTLTLGTATVSNGQMTGFTAGSGTPVQITIDSSHATLAGVASQINAAKAGVTASVVTDGSGARLVLRGSTGAAQAFTLTATEDSNAPGLASLNVGPGASGTTIGGVAQDAVVAFNGVQFHRASNQIGDLVAGVNLNLVSAQPGTVVSLGASTPTDALSEAVSDFVDTYNQFHSVIAADLDAKDGGTLSQDLAARQLNTSMAQLTLAQLIKNPTPGQPTTLAQIGVGTNRDGTLTVDTATLTQALADHPEAVETMFTQSTDGSGDGLSNKLASITNTASSFTLGLALSTQTYTAKQKDIADQQSALSDKETAYQAQLTTLYSAMNTQVSSYKSTQTFLTNQIAAWNKSTS